MSRNIIDQQIIENQFISFCKTVLCNELRNIHAEEKRRNEKFISFDDLTSLQLNELYECDYYEIESTAFQSHGHKVFIEDELIAEAVFRLPTKQKDIILLSFFLEKKDVEVALLLGIAQSTLYYHKTKAFEEMRKFIKEANSK